MSQTTNGYQTNLVSSDVSSSSARQQFVIRSLLSKVRTSQPVEVLSVTNDGGISPIGYVDIQPLVGQLDGNGNVVPHGPIYNVPYMRIQGGGNAVIIDPEVGDIGLASFCDRDISAVKVSGAASPPGSKRKHDMSDAVYTSTIIAAAPTQYVQFNASGINIVSPTAVTITAPSATITTTGATQVNALTVSVEATTSASVTAPSITLGATGQTLLAFVTSAFSTLFNGHTHKVNTLGAQTDATLTPMSSAQLTTTVKGG